MMEPRHFLDIDQLTPGALRGIVDQSLRIKRDKAAASAQPLAGRTLALIFEQPSTRTRVSFEVGMRQLGGEVIVLSKADMQSSRGETMADTARVLSRYVDLIMLRTNDKKRLEEMAAHATVPVINGLTNWSHPCQVMADILTFEERHGSISGRVVAWSGDGNNVVGSWVHAAVRFGFELRLACPDSLQPPQSLIQWATREGGKVSLTSDPLLAVRGADCVVTDTWVSMSTEEAGSRHNLLAPYRVDRALMAQANPAALFMHCLPAHRGEEVTAEVIDGPQSVVWEEAENRLHAQKSILLWCMGL